MLCALALPAGAQSVPRIKASVVAFDGATLTVKPDGDKDTMKIGIRPATQILKEEPKNLADIPPGSFVGAVLTKSPIGALSAQEVHVFPDSLRGSGEGLYPASPGSSRFVLNGSVSASSATSISIKFHGAGGEGVRCTGRAPLDPLKGCQGSAIVMVAAGTPVLALAAADKNEIKPGSVLALSIMAGPDGRPVSPGLTIETMATPDVPLPDAPSYARQARSPKSSSP